MAIMIMAATQMSIKNLFDDTIENICQRIKGYRNMKEKLND